MKYCTLIAVFLFSTAIHAQKGKPPKNVKKVDEEVEKPPPPQEMLMNVRIDTSSNDIEAPPPRSEFSKEDFFFNLPDTSAAPKDELTKQIKAMLDLTGALNIGLEYARLMQTDNEKERNGLPKEFYERMYAELTKGPFRDMFENALIKAYRKYYTLEDVNGLIGFYKSDIGQKMLKQLPDIMKESQEVGMSIGRVLGMKVYNDLIKEEK